MEALQEPPEGINLDANRLPKLIAVSVTTWVLGIITVILRVTGRKISRNGLWWDDWLIIAAQLWTGAYMLIVTAYLGSHGLGRHVWAVPPDALRSYLLGTFIGEYAYSGSMAMIKWSALALYWRIFGADSRLRAVILIMFAIVASWLIAVFLVTTFQCLPPSAFWRRFDFDDPIINYSCRVDSKTFFMANAISNSITDLLVLLVPVPSIWALQLRRTQKVALLGIFAVGLFVTAVSVIRLVLTLDKDPRDVLDLTWNYVEGKLWTEVELNVATICACLPSLKPVLNLLIYGTPTTPYSQPHSYEGVAKVASSREHAKWESAMESEWYGSTAYARSGDRSADDLYSLSCVTDGDSDGVRRGDTEMDRMSGKWASGVVVTTDLEVRMSVRE
ncbi:hypothetical protein ACJ41O_007204 [Fusarium nematophilum]